MRLDLVDSLHRSYTTEVCTDPAQAAGVMIKKLSQFPNSHSDMYSCHACLDWQSYHTVVSLETTKFRGLRSKIANIPTRSRHWLAFYLSTPAGTSYSIMKQLFGLNQSCARETSKSAKSKIEKPCRLRRVKGQKRVDRLLMSNKRVYWSVNFR